MDTGNIAYRPKTLGVSDALRRPCHDNPAPARSSRPGVVLTASGLTFVGRHGMISGFRAFCENPPATTGEKLWEITSCRQSV